MFKIEAFGTLNGMPINKYIISNSNLIVKVMPYGATITDIIYINDENTPLNIALNYASFNEYLTQKAYYGAIIGRYANRIGCAKFSLNGKDYNVSKNENGNCLHGGVNGFDKKIWQVETLKNNSITFSLTSADGEEGFPSTVKVLVTYTVTNDNSLKIEYNAVSDGDTYINLTNHSYFNLSGIENRVDDNMLYINANKITKTTIELIPNGEYINVFNTLYDFNEPRYFIKDLSSDETLSKRGCYDDNYVLNGSGFRKVASLSSNETKLKMNVYTDQKGMQIYTGNAHGIALETQNFANAMNVNGFPSPLLKKGERYKTVTEYKFFIEK